MNKTGGFLLGYIISSALMVAFFSFGYHSLGLIVGVFAAICIFICFQLIDQSIKRNHREKMTNNRTIEQLEEIVQKQREDKTGIREPDQHSLEAHELYCRKMEAEFTPRERRVIRNKIGLEIENNNE